MDWAESVPAQRHRAIDATFCLVDVAGFTALSERLARRGRIGAEELTVVLNGVFGELLRIAYLDHGTLVKFGGDALLLAFDGDDHADRACRAALTIRAALRRGGAVTTDVGTPSAPPPHIRLRMSVGVHSGSFDLFRVGSSHHELIVTGPAASTVARLQSSAGAGEILVSPATADAVDPRFIGRMP